MNNQPLHQTDANRPLFSLENVKTLYLWYEQQVAQRAFNYCLCMRQSLHQKMVTLLSSDPETTNIFMNHYGGDHTDEIFSTTF